MSSDAALEQILDGVYKMAMRKRAANKTRPENEKYAELVRVRLGSRLPVYLPQRITSEVVGILQDFQKKARLAGIRQFFIQTHVRSSMEITRQVKRGTLRRLNQARWLVINQHVFTAAASRRGHNAKLRQTLGEVGIIPCTDFRLRGIWKTAIILPLMAAPFRSRWRKRLSEGSMSEQAIDELSSRLDQTEEIVDHLAELRGKEDIAFMATDRNVLNIVPGVGKSL